jgi:hypothetical protein
VIRAPGVHAARASASSRDRAVQAVLIMGTAALATSELEDGLDDPIAAFAAF